MLARQVLPLIIAYANNGEAIGGRTRFQKMIFVLQNNARFMKERYNFIPHDYGPYSPELQADIDELIDKGLLRGVRETIDEGKIRYQYAITPVGATALTNILRNSQVNKKFRLNRTLQIAMDIKGRLNRKDLPSLLADIYTEYPDFAKHSKYKF